ncbi:MAG: BspA family leucine-rich repeat surface protein [Cyclobacteriaceae bacterium]
MKVRYLFLNALLFAFLLKASSQPTLSTLSPTDNATDVAVTSNLVITFSENIAYGGGTIKLKESNGNTVETYTASADGPTLTLSGASLTINPTSDLGNNMLYYLEFSSTAIKNASNQFFLGFTSPTTWNFTTIATGVAPTDIVLTFSSFSESVTNGQQLGFISSTDGDANTSYYEIIPSPGEDWYEDIYVGSNKIYAGYNGFDYDQRNVYRFQIKAVDDDNNVFYKHFNLQLTNDNPQRKSTYPADDATDVSLNHDLSITFNNLLQKGTGNIEIKRVSDDAVFETIDVASTTIHGSSLIISPSSDFAASTEYYVTIDLGAVKDLSGSSFIGFDDQNWSFTTGTSTDNVAPGESDLYPGHGSSSSGISIGPYYEFDEQIRAGTGKIYLKRLSDHTKMDSVDASELTIIGETAHFGFNEAVAYSTQYYMEIPAGAIEDMAGNAFGGTNSATWNFTTTTSPVDTNYPFVQSVYPLNGTTGVSIHTDFRLDYNENMKSGTGDILIKRASDDQLVFTINQNDLTIQYSIITFTVPSALATSTEYYIEMAAGVLEDQAGNDSEAISKGQWNFTTGGDIVTVNDPDFKEYLMLLVDANGDEEIQETEAASFTGTIDYTDQGLTDATGIEAFTGVTRINIYDNQLTELDLSNLTSLESIYGYRNNLNAIQFAASAPLQAVIINNNALTEIALDNYTTLTDVSLNSNSLHKVSLQNNSILSAVKLNVNSLISPDSIVLTGSNAITTLELQQNYGLTGVDVSSQTLLERFYAFLTSIETIDLSNNTALTHVGIRESNLTALDLSHHSLLVSLDLRNAELIKLNVQNGNNSNVTTFQITGNADLECVTVDDVDYSTTNWTNKDAQTSYAESCFIPFITTWETTSDNETITIPTTGTGYDYIVDWGDGVIDSSHTTDASHEYATAGTYQVSVYGDFPKIYFAGGGDKDKIQSIDQWGDIAWTGMNNAFFGCSNLTYNATDLPDLSRVGTMLNMFAQATSFNGDVSGWDVSNVLNMQGLFSGATSFNQDISSWDVSNVTTMKFMFSSTSFDQPIGSWNVGKVVRMDGMFQANKVFNQDLSDWNVSAVQYMNDMFSGANAFDGDISTWDVGEVLDMDNLFTNAWVFNQDLSGWNVAKVQTMDQMFYVAMAFNQDISGWEVGACTNMTQMFRRANSFDQNLGGWDVSAVTTMSTMFLQSGLSKANYDNLWNGWVNLPSLQANVNFGSNSLKYCYSQAARDTIVARYNWTIGADTRECVPFATTWETTTTNETITIPTTGTGYDYIVDWGDGVTDSSHTGDASHEYASAGTYTVSVYGDFPGIYFNNTGDKTKIKTIESWGDIAWGSMEWAFRGCEDLTYNATDAPDLSGVTALYGTFADCDAFNGDIGNWDVSTINNMTYLFLNDTSFNQDISGWDVSNVTSLNSTFYGASNFNQPIGSWDVSEVLSFNQTFVNCEDFNQDIGSWNVAKATSMSNMFSGATTFNQDIGSWNVGNVTDMYAMFVNAHAFNQDISGWNVSKVENMHGMFLIAKAFDQDISSWNVSKVTTMRSMFDRNEVFNQNLGDWDVSSVTTMKNMFYNTPMSRENYDSTLIGWVQQPLLKSNVEFGVNGQTYCAGDSARTVLIDTYNWVITGDSEDCPDMEAPEPVTYSPVDNATDVSRSNNIVLTFNEDIELGSGTITLGYTGVVGQQFAIYSIPGASEVTTNGTQLIINPATDLPASQDISVLISDGAIADLNNNEFGGITDENAWNFTTIDDLAPLHTSLSPSHESTFGWLCSCVNINFNEDVQEGSGTVSLYQADGTLVETVTTGVSDTRVTFPATFRAAVDFNADYAEGAEYYVVVSEGAFEDVAGNAFAGIASGDWSYTANQRPHVSTLSPEASAVGVALSPTFSIDFDTNIYGRGNTESNLYIKNYNTDTLVATVNSEDMTIVNSNTSFTLSSDLAPNVKYYIVADADGVFASELNAEVFRQLTEKDDWTFTTLIPDVDAPDVVSFSPTHDETGVSTDVTFSITFNEPIAFGGEVGYIRIRHADGSTFTNIQFSQASVDAGWLSINESVVTFSRGTLAIGTEYFITIDDGVVADTAGNELTGRSVNDMTWWHITTGKHDQTITFEELDQKTYGDSKFKLTATTTSQLPITYSSSDESVATIDGDSVIVVGAGTTTITASQAGDAQYNAAEATQDLVVNKASQSVTFSALSAKTYGDDKFVLAASATSGLAVSYMSSDENVATISGDSVTIIGGGTATITASQAGDARYNVAEATQDLVVNKASQSVTFSELSAKTYGDDKFVLAASATSGLDVSYTSSDETVATISGDSVTIIGGGTTTITASQTGNDNYSAADAQQILTISKADQTISIDSIPDKVITDEPFIISASSSVGLELAYAIDGPATIAGSEVTLTGAGEVTVTARQSGNDNYNSAEATISFLVSKISQSISVDTSYEVVYGDESFNLSVQSSSGLSLAYFDYDSTVISVSNGTVSIVGAGTTEIHASQEGDDTYLASDTVTIPLEVSKATLGVDVKDTTRIYGIDNPSLELVYTGFVNGDDEGAISTPPVASTSSAKDSDVGEYEISISGGVANNYDITYGTGTLTIVKASQIVAFDSISDVNLSVGEVSLNAEATSGLSVTYEITDGSGSIGGSKLSFDEPGSISVKASQSGNGNYLAAESVVRTFEVINDNAGTTDQSITFELVDSVYENADPITLEASATSELAVTFKIISGPGVINEGVLSWTRSGLITVAANQPGNDTFAAADQVTQEIKVIELFDLKGSASLGDGSVFTDGKVYASNGVEEFVAEIQMDGTYQFEGFYPGTWYVKVIPNDQTLFYPTFYGNAIFWEDATPIVIDANTLDVDISIQEKPLENELDGAGVIEGQIIESTNGRTEVVSGRVEDGTPVEDVSVFLIRVSDGAVLTEVKTDENGEFRIEGVPEGEYELKIEVVGITMALENSTITVSDEEPVVLTAMVAEEGIIVEVEQVLSTPEQIDINVYPNPSSDRFLLNLEVDQIMLIDQQGRTLRNVNNSREIEVYDLSAGSYFLNVINKEKKSVHRVIINR